MAKLRAEFAALQRDAMRSGTVVDHDITRYQNTLAGINGAREGFNVATAAAGEFQIIQQKLVSQSNAYAESLKNGKASFMDAVKNRHVFNQVLREQIALQNASSLAWSVDNTGRISSDLIIPKNLPADLITVRQRAGLWNQMIHSVSANTINWGKNTQWAGRQLMTGFSLPLGMLAAATGKFAYDTQQQLTAVIKVYGDVTTGFTESADTIKKNAMSTVEASARMYGQSSTDTLSIMKQFAAAGRTGTELQRDTLETSKISLAGELKWQDAAAASLTLQSVYKLNADGLGDAFAYINAMENQTILTTQDFVIAIPKVVGVMQSMGASLQDVGTLMAAMKQGGIEAAVGANALKTISFRSMAPYAKGAETFKETTGRDLGELVKQTNGEVVPTLMKFGEAIAGLTRIQRIAVVKDVFGIYQGSRVFTLLQQLLSGSEQMNQAFKVGTNTAAQNASILKQELETIAQSDYQKIKVAWESIKITLSEVGAKVLPVGAAVVKSIGDLVKWFNALDEGTKKWALIGTGVVAAAGPLIMITGLAANLVGNLGRIATALFSLVLRFRITDAAERAQMLQGKLATQVWDLKTQAIQRQTMALSDLTKIMSAAIVRESPWLAPGANFINHAQGQLGPKTTEQIIAEGNQGRIRNGQGFVAARERIPTKANMNNLPVGWSGGGQEQLRNASGRFATEQQLLAVQRQEAIAQNEINKVKMQTERLTARQAIAEADVLLVQQAEAAAQQKVAAATAARTAASRSMGLGIGGGLMGAGLIGTMATDSDSLISKLAQIATMIGITGLMFPKLLGGMAMGFKQTAINLGAGISNMTGGVMGKAVLKAKSGVGSMLGALKSAGPAIGVLAVGVALFWKAVSDEQEKARKATEAYNNTTKDMAKALGFSYQEIGKEFKNSVLQPYTEAAQNVRKFKDTNAAGAEVFRNMVNPNDANAEGKRWSEALIQGAAVRLHGGSVKMAEDAALTVMKLMGSAISEAEFKAEIKVRLNFENTEATMDTVLSGITTKIQDAAKDNGPSSITNWFTRIGQSEDITPDAADKIKKQAAEFASIFNNTASSKQASLLTKFAESMNSGYDKAFEQAKMNNPKFLEEQGITNGQQWAAAFAKAADYTWLVDQGFEGAQKDSIQKFADAQKFLTNEIAKSVFNQTDEVAGSLKRIEDLGQFTFITLGEAQDRYRESIKLHTLASGDLSEVKVLELLNVQRAAAGYTLAKHSSEGFTEAIKGAAAAAGTAAASVDNLASALTRAGITRKAEEVVQSLKTVYTDATAGIASDISDRMDTEAANRLSATQAAGERALAAIDRRSSVLENSQEKATEKMTARHEKEKEAIKSVEDVRKKAIQNAIKAEENAENLRQKIFEAEKTRIQRLAEMANKTIDLDMAINSGNLDEAAKIQNDVYAMQNLWATEGTMETSKTASAKKIDALQLRLDTLSKIEDVERKSVESRQKNEEKVLKNQQEAAKGRVDAEKKAQQEINKNQEAAIQKRSATNKKGFDQDLATLKMTIPTNEATMATWIGRLKAIYRDYGDGTLKPQGIAWSNIIANSLRTSVLREGAKVASDKAWTKAGTDIVRMMLKGGFNMTPAQFKEWIEGGALPANALSPATVSGPTHTAKRPVNKGLFSAGGPVYGEGTGTSDSIRARLSHGEYVVNAQKTAKNRALLDAINYGRGYASGGLVTSGIGGPPVMGMAGLMRGIINDSINAAATRRLSGGTGPLAMEGGASTPPSLDGASLVEGPGGGNMEGGTRDLLVAFGRLLLGRGFAVGEHPLFGGVAPVHTQNSWHYKSGAVDVNYDGRGPGVEKSKMNSIISLAHQYGLRAIWQYPGHYDHGHFDIGPGMDLGNFAGAFRGGVSGGGGKTTRNANTAMGQKMAAARGWTGAQWTALNRLWTGESGWNHLADNPTSDAYGIPQALPGSKMSSSGADWRTNPATQIDWGMKYIKSRYGSPSAALGFWNAQKPHWYSEGGYVMPQMKSGGYTLNDGYAKLHNRETVLTAPLSQQLKEGIGKLATDGGVSYTYTIKADFNGATFGSDVDVERAFENLMKKAERKSGVKRSVGDRR